MRELVFKTPSRTLRDLHRDVWRLAHSPADRGQNKRSFLFRWWSDDGVVLVRGPLLPARHSTLVRPPVAGGHYRLDVLFRPVCHVAGKERLVAHTDLGKWLTAHMAGMQLLDWKCSGALAFEMDYSGRPLRAYNLKGSVRITDSEKAMESCLSGFGRSKGFGFGLPLLLAEKSMT